eukprot:4696593-Pleurochrysis_carterae.AAC.1
MAHCGELATARRTCSSQVQQIHAKVTESSTEMCTSLTAHRRVRINLHQHAPRGRLATERWPDEHVAVAGQFRLVCLDALFHDWRHDLEALARELVFDGALE